MFLKSNAVNAFLILSPTLLHLVKDQTTYLTVTFIFISDICKQIYAYLLTICILTGPVISVPSSLEVFRSNLGYSSDNDAGGADADASNDEKDLWRRRVLDDVPPAQLRWRTPCSGSSPAHGVRIDGIFDSVETAAVAPHQHFNIIALKAMAEHGKVTSLMSKYVSSSFTIK